MNKETAILIERVVFIAMIVLGSYIIFSEVYGGVGNTISKLATSLAGLSGP